MAENKNMNETLNWRFSTHSIRLKKIFLIFFVNITCIVIFGNAIVWKMQYIYINYSQIKIHGNYVFFLLIGLLTLSNRTSSHKFLSTLQFVHSVNMNYVNIIFIVKIHQNLCERHLNEHSKWYFKRRSEAIKWFQYFRLYESKWIFYEFKWFLLILTLFFWFLKF